MEKVDEYFAPENVRNNEFDVEFNGINTSCYSNSYVTENSASPGSPYCNYLPSDLLNMLQFGPNSYDSSFESADLVQSGSNLLELESQRSISSNCFEFDFPSDSSLESVNLMRKQSNFVKFERQKLISSKCFEFDVPSDSLNFVQSISNSFDSSLESANLVQNQSDFSKFESQHLISSNNIGSDVLSDSLNLLFEPNSCDSRSESVNLVQKQSNFSISSTESVDFLDEKNTCFEFDFPSDSLNLVQAKPNSIDSSSESSNLVQNQSNFSMVESPQSISNNCFEFDFPSNSYNLLHSGPNSSLESANLVQNQSKFLRLESQRSIPSTESIYLLKEEGNCFEFDFPSNSFNLLPSGPNSSSESANLAQNQRNFSRFESQPSISSAESVDFVEKESRYFEPNSDSSSKSANFVQNRSNFSRFEPQSSISSAEFVDSLKEKSKCFEFAPKPKIIIDLTSPKPKKTGSHLSISRSESMKTKNKCLEFEVEPRVIIDLTSPKPRKPDSQLSISRPESTNFEQQINSKCFEFKPKHPQISSSKSCNLHERKPSSLKIDLSALQGGVKRRREAEEGGEEVAVRKFEKTVEEWPLTPSRWNAFWDENSNGMYGVPLLSPLSPHPPLGCAQLMVV